MSDSSNGRPRFVKTDFYRTDAQHLLAGDVYRADGPNIGRSGAYLTLCCLVDGDLVGAERLLASIGQFLPWFAGEVLIGERSGKLPTLDAVRAASEALPMRSRLLTLDAGLTYAAARNRMADAVTTEWMLLLDESSAFIASVLPTIQRDLARLGCRFANLPLVEADTFARRRCGVDLLVDSAAGELRVVRQNAGALAEAAIHNGQPYLSTLLHSNAALMHGPTFRELGGFDENLAAGLEEIDFSLRLFRAGFKVGNVGAVALAQKTAAEKRGAGDDKRLVAAACEHFAIKHRLQVESDGVMTGSGTVGKLENKNAGADPVSRSSACEQGNHDARPKVALLVDVENWAFWNISQQLVRHLSDRFEFRVIKAVAFNNLVQAVFAGVGCDVFHFFWREDARQLLSDHCRSYVEWMGIPYERFLDNVLRQFALSTCVYDHLAIEPEERALRRVVYTDLLDAYYVGSNRLATLYRESPGYPAPAAVLSDGVDRERFYRLNAERFDAVAHRPLVIGWVGNSAWGDGRADYKGVRTILLPAIERLQAEGFRVRADIVDRAAGRSVPHDQMVNYYRDIDLYICTSSVEGTPNPVLESMACGVPIVSTDVGIVPDAFGPQQREFILHERSVNAVVAAVKRLLETPALFRRLSDENIRAVEDWYWDQRVLGFADYFETCLQRRNQRLAGKT